jgi:dihydroorotate dehydrogenase (NAD+) catalytic subunit
MGGIMNTSDALEFLLAGASAVQIGTASFIDPQASVKILEGIEEYLLKKGFKDISEIIGYINKKG